MKIRNFDFQVNMSGLVSEQVFDGEEYYVVPVVMIKEGVWNENKYTPEVLEDSVQAWNGRPLVVNHPKDDNGNLVSANSPEILEKFGVGYTWNVRFEDNKLKANAWFNKKKTEKFPRVNSQIQNGAIMEFSTGLFMRPFTNEQGESEVRDMVPDHLAVLPDKIGACSWRDGGGGPRVNHREEGEISFKDKVLSALGFKSNEASHGELRRKLLDILSNEYNLSSDEGDAIYLDAVYDDYIVFSVMRSGRVEDQLFSQNYSYNEDNDSVELTGDPQKVKKEYVEVAQEAQLENNTNEGGVDDMERQKVINALIVNEYFTEGERSFLESLDDSQLQVLQAREQNRTIPEPDLSELLGNVSDSDNEALIAARDTYKAVANGENTEPANIDEFIEGAPDEFKGVLQDSVKAFNESKSKIIKALVSNDNCDYTEKELGSKSRDELIRLSKLAGSKVSFAGNDNQDPEPETNDKKNVPDMPKLSFGNQ